MVYLCLSLILVSFAISCPATWMVIGLGRRFGQLDTPDAPGSGGRKNHVAPIPNTGGIAIFWGLILPIVLLLGAAWLWPMTPGSLPDWLDPVRAHIPGLRSQTMQIAGVVVSMLVLHILGIVDDRLRLGPFLKLGIQFGVGLTLVLFCGMRILEFLDHYPGGFLASVALSLIWIVIVTNALNFLDNMDGLASGIGIICAGLYLGATLINGQWFIAALAALLIGALLGFLVFNFPPAKVFMGDGGSLVLGLTLAILTTRTTYFDTVHKIQFGHWYGVLMPLMVLAVPLYDFTSVTLIRLGQGRSPFVGDQQHFSHRLVQRGLTKPAAVFVIWLCTLATGLAGVMLSSLSAWQAAIAGAQTIAVLCVLALLERGINRRA